MLLYAQVPLVTVLMSGKRKKDYEAVFLVLKELLTENGAEIKAQEFMLDFEAAVWKVMIFFIIII